VVAALRERPDVGLAELAETIGEAPERVHRAVEALAREGIAAADDAALYGDPCGRVTLPA
jgi:DNA-binding IclR family transcriptional regulator